MSLAATSGKALHWTLCYLKTVNDGDEFTASAPKGIHTIVAQEREAALCSSRPGVWGPQIPPRSRNFRILAQEERPGVPRLEKTDVGPEDGASAFTKVSRSASASPIPKAEARMLI